MHPRGTEVDVEFKVPIKKDFITLIIGKGYSLEKNIGRQENGQFLVVNLLNMYKQHETILRK